MDDDLTFGASVWAVDEPTPSVATTQLEDHTFDDFDDFGNASAIAEDDDFGDFGDFGEAEAGSSLSFAKSAAFDDRQPIAGPSRQSHWCPLQLDPIPPRNSLESEINHILAPIWLHEDISKVTTDEGIREVEGPAQILLSPSSREIYRTLLQTPPPTKPPNWTRSRIRRQHLITLGIPVNLDEVLPRVNGKPMPTLEIHTRPMSAPPGPRHPQQPNGSSGANHNSRSGTPQPGARPAFAQFGPKPELDMARINKLLQLNHESMTMQPLSSLERYLAEIRQHTANTSDLLTHLLQSRDALQQDSETYNGLIAEMVGEAQKLKSGKLGRTGSRRGSNMP